MLPPAVAGVGIGLINGTGNLGGTVGPYFFGYVRTWTGSFSLALAVGGISLILASLVAIPIEGPCAARTPAARGGSSAGPVLKRAARTIAAALALAARLALTVPMDAPGQPESPRRARPRLGRVRLEEVAAAAGVSPVTVSRALRQPDLVARHDAGRGAAGGRASSATSPTSSPAALLPSAPGRLRSWSPPSAPRPSWTRSAASPIRLRPLGYEFVLGDTNLSGDNETELVTSLLGRRADAVISTDVAQSPATRGLLERSRVPVVETWTLDARPDRHECRLRQPRRRRDAARHMIVGGAAGMSA